MATKAKRKAERPVVSVGIIFKNERRCLERCLQSLEPLRQRLALELVMEGVALAHAFARAEREYLPRMYTPEAQDALLPLPLMHRAGVCCVRTFDALDAGDPLRAIRALRQGLENCPEMKPLAALLMAEIEQALPPEQKP